ncbi:MAG: hypothetical protein ACT6Q9_17425 [Polaromonas sp.]|uniref:hypothetical protein n=1 Tax=Polaromonas sp. TaxID=1869339 RepID=UPI004036C368
MQQQASEAPAPSVEEFLMTRDDMELALAIRKLQHNPKSPGRVPLRRAAQPVVIRRSKAPR